MKRSERFLKAMEDLIDVGVEFAPEIESEVRSLDSEEFSEFILQAIEVTDTASGILRNLLIDAEIKVRVRTGSTR